MRNNVGNELQVPLRKLRKTRLKCRVKQKTVANFLGVSTQFYSQIERGVNNLSFENAYKLAYYFQTTTDDLFKEDFERADKFLRMLEHQL